MIIIIGRVASWLWECWSVCDDGWLEGFGVDVWLVDYDDGWLIEMTACSKASMWGGAILGSWLD